MKTAATVVCLALLLLSGAAWGGLVQKEKGVWTDDFEGEIFLDWDSARGSRVETVDMMGNAMLSIKKSGSTTLVGVRPKRFSVSVDVRGYGGIRVGGKYTVITTDYFGGQIEVRDGRKLLLRQELAKATVVTQRITVVSSGPLLRVFVGRQLVYERIGQPIRSSIELVAEEKGALFDNLRVSANLSPQDGIAAVPVAEKNALVFKDDHPVRVALDATNQTPGEIKLAASVSRFKATPISAEEAEKPNGRTVVEYGVNTFAVVEALPEQSLGQADTPLAAGKVERVTMDFGKIPAGLYMLALTTAGDNTTGATRLFPLVVISELPPQPEKKPIVIGCYTKQMHYFSKNKGLWANTYAHAVAYDLRANGFNAVVASGNFAPDICDIFAEYGIRVLSRGGAELDHPNVIGSLVADEPKPGDVPMLKEEYAKYEPSGKSIVTCCVGDGMGLGGPGGPTTLWREWKPKTRMFRWYGIKKTHYGVLHHCLYKGGLPFTSVLRIADAFGDTPFWVVLPSFGGTGHESYYMYPTSGDMRAMMHLSAAYGARGMLLYTYQGMPGKFQGMVNSLTLERHGDTLAGAGTAATKIAQQAELIASLKLGGVDVRCPSLRTHVLPVQNDAGKYIYVVNKDAHEPDDTRLLFRADQYSITEAKDLFTGEALKVNGRDEKGYVSVSISLEPGQGRLIASDIGSAKTK